MPSWFRRMEGTLNENGLFLIQVRAKPRSARDRILPPLAHSEAIEVAITAPPVDGEANKAIIELLAKELGLKKSAVSMVRGGQARFKQIMVDGVTEDILRALEKG